MSAAWNPLVTRDKHGRPTAGDLIAYAHGVWRVTAVTPLDLDDADREVWLAAGMPDLDGWKRSPYRVHVDHVGGVEPPGGDPDQPTHGTLDVRTGHSVTWHVYRSDRWPQCSCCGEPMPCRAELQDREIDRGMAAVERHSRKQPGSCWGCAEPITRRQRFVAYPGDNLDLPGGMQVRFHTRQSCESAAEAYELRWIAVDPRRERILTWPKCRGILYVHADGSSECVSGANPVGTESVREPDCRGHLTHDHGTRAACYVSGGWFATDLEDRRCPRGCTSAGHPGTRTTPRPSRPRQEVLTP